MYVGGIDAERDALATLDHPNIVNMIAAIEGEVGQTLVMEHVGGGSLESLIQEQGPLPLGRAIEITLDLADAGGGLTVDVETGQVVGVIGGTFSEV